MECKKDGSGDVTLMAIFLFVFKKWAEHPLRMMLVVILALSSALSDILIPVFAADFVNVLTQGGSPFLSFFMMMGLGAAGALLRQCLNLNIASLTLTMMSLAGARAFKQIQSLTADWHANGFAGSTVRQITRGMWALVAFNETLLAGLLPIGAMLIGSTVSVWLHWPMAGGVFGIGGILFSIVAVLLTVLYVAPAARTGNAWDSRIGGALADALTCNSVVKAFGAEVREEERLARILAAWRRHTSWAWMRSNVNGGVQEIMLVALQTLVLGVLLLLWRRGVINVGDITFMLTTLFMLQGYLRRIGSNFRHLQRAMNELEAMVAFKRLPAEGRADDKGNAVTISRGEICFSDVDFSYSGSGVPQLYQKMNVRIKAGERVGLVGYSGSGKSTFVRLIQRLYDVQGGKITIDGQDITRMQLASLRRQIATVPQEPLLFHRSLSENIAYAKPDATQDEIERAAKLAGIHTLISRLPEGYDTLVGERGVKLSGGERQRVAIARAFLVDMPILILDEATSSLDNESEAHIQRSMNELMNNRTTLVIAHRLSTLRRMDRILVFSHGRIVEQGSHDDLIAIERGVYRKLFERQQMTEKNTHSPS
ncbi:MULTISPECIES: ABC transporter ATP-binding protein [Serratia]|uniref:ABC transporter ATP-binding protein n=1 Tax=Serratia TaxID=613 RepID=UPI0006685C96|nr:ABC transporter ATP-binding protein [Serratia marcescens]MCF1610695.1 ABC transporter ATP-binding protein/permease [Serratia marcescens]NRN18577.1 ABC transporter ATP-binding protein [Serratia marcescens]NRN23904.1 ABC transporter ATP-binding protein [Serratia marcescens]NRN53627.1 ABC transporter ATP-binding protein [Serratia marcescens]HBN5892972.1 ABC transporter ATP-binding protein [Serratia marcescens]